MTNTEKAKITRTLHSKNSYKVDDRCEIIKFTGRYYPEYSLREFDGTYWQTVKCTYFLEEILDLL